MPASPSAGALGELSGQVWFDANRNGQRDLDESPLPGMLVTITLARAAVAPASTGPATMQAADIVALVRTAVTDQRGGYRFNDIGAGRYEVGLSAPSGSVVDPSWTTTASTWRAPVDVVPGQVAVVDFAATGSASAAGVVVDGAGTIVPDADVTCTWAGLDQRFGTADDVPFESASDHEGAFEFDAVPVGEMACWALDTRSGASTSSIVAVATPSADAPVWLVLQFGGPSSAGVSSTLPATGGAALPLVRLALMLVIVGSVAVLVTRRRPAVA